MKKVVFQSMSLVVISMISTKLVLACSSVVCTNGVETNLCSLGANEHLAQTYFISSSALFLVSLILYFVVKRKSSFIVFIAFSFAFLPIIFRWCGRNGGCDFLAASVAKWFFYSSALLFTFQIITRIVQLKKLKIKLR